MNPLISATQAWDVISGDKEPTEAQKAIASIRKMDDVDELIEVGLKAFETIYDIMQGKVESAITEYSEHDNETGWSEVSESGEAVVKDLQEERDLFGDFMDKIDEIRAKKFKVMRQ